MEFLEEKRKNRKVGIKNGKCLTTLLYSANHYCFIKNSHQILAEIVAKLRENMSPIFDFSKNPRKTLSDHRFCQN